jgi:hypothetical protein
MKSLGHHMFSSAFAKVALVSVLSAGVMVGEVQAYDLTVPSGQIVTLDEQLVVPPGNHILYLGFTAPSIGGDYAVTFDRAILDIDTLCETVGIPEAGKLIGQGILIDELVIRLMERLIPYGEVDAEAAQFLNAYDISGGTCVWL